MNDYGWERLVDWALSDLAFKYTKEKQQLGMLANSGPNTLVVKKRTRKKNCRISARRIQRSDHNSKIRTTIPSTKNKRSIQTTIPLTCLHHPPFSDGSYNSARLTDLDESGPKHNRRGGLLGDDNRYCGTCVRQSSGAST